MNRGRPVVASSKVPTKWRWSGLRNIICDMSPPTSLHNNTQMTRLRITLFTSYILKAQEDKVQIRVHLISVIWKLNMVFYTQTHKGTLSVFRGVPRTTIGSVHILATYLSGNIVGVKQSLPVW